MTAQLEEFTVAGDNQAVVGVKWCVMTVSVATGITWSRCGATR